MDKCDLLYMPNALLPAFNMLVSSTQSILEMQLHCLLMGCCKLEDAEFKANDFVLVPYNMYCKDMYVPCRILQLEDDIATLNFEWCLEDRRFDANSNDYAKSEIRRYINSQKFKAKISPLLHKLIIRSKVPYKDQILNDDFWLLSHEEVGVAKDWFVDNKNAQWFSQTFKTDKSRQKFCIDSTKLQNDAVSKCSVGGSASYWWLRSAYSDDVNGVGRVNSDGEVYDYSASNYYGCSPAFKINLSLISRIAT